MIHKTKRGNSINSTIKWTHYTYLFPYKEPGKNFKLKILHGNLLQPLDTYGPSDTFTERENVLSYSSSKQGYQGFFYHLLGSCNGKFDSLFANSLCDAAHQPVYHFCVGLEETIWITEKIFFVLFFCSLTEATASDNPFWDRKGIPGK